MVFSSPSGLAHKISSRPCVLETTQCHLRGSYHLHLRRKQQAVLVRIHASSLFSPATLVCFSISPPIFLKITLPKCLSTVLHGHRHHLLFLSNHNVTPNLSLPRSTECPPGTDRACRAGAGRRSAGPRVLASIG